MRVDRISVRVGILTDGSTGAIGGHPSALKRLNVGLIPHEQSAWSAGPPAAFPAGSEITLENSGVRVQAPRRFASDGPVTAIAIAPDSPIEACDIYIGGQQGTVHRVGIGAPYIGAIDESKDLIVCTVRDTPPPLRREFMLGTLSGDGQTSETEFWEMDFSNNGAGAFGSTFTIPLRLDFYRGSFEKLATAIPSMMQKRARYSANVAWEIKDRGAGVPTIPALTMIVDGRRRVRVIAGRWVGGGVGNLHVHGIEGRPGYIGDRATTTPAGVPLDWPIYDEMLAPTAIAAVPGSTIFDLPGNVNPYWAIQAAIEGGTIGERGFVTIHAWDE